MANRAWFAVHLPSCPKRTPDQAAAGGMCAISAGNNADTAASRPDVPSSANTRLLAGISESAEEPHTNKTGLFDFSLASTARYISPGKSVTYDYEIEFSRKRHSKACFTRVVAVTLYPASFRTAERPSETVVSNETHNTFGSSMKHPPGQLQVADCLLPLRAPDCYRA